MNIFEKFIEYFSFNFEIEKIIKYFSFNFEIRNEYITLMESYLLLDSLVCCTIFIKDFFIFKSSLHNFDTNTVINCQNQIVEKYNKIYTLSTFDRYLIYLTIYFLSLPFTNYSVTYNYNYFLLLFSLPQVQNTLCRYFKTSLENYLLYKTMFIKYSISKLSIHFIQNLHPQIQIIPNYHIFILYKLLNYTFVFDIFKNFFFFSLLTFLRKTKDTYYYYKGIKMAYYYNFGYLYNVIPTGDAVYLVNTIISQKRWREISKIEITNAFFVLFSNKYNLFSTVSQIASFQIILFQIFSLYSIISLFKMINTTNYFSHIFVCISITSMTAYFVKFDFKNIFTSIFVYFLILFNINDLLITIIILIHKGIYYWFEEMWFFINHTKNIKKVITMYERNIELI